MRVLSKFVLAAIALGALTTTASAAVNLVGEAGLSTNPGPGLGETMVWNFDTGITAIEDTTHFSFSGSVFASPVVNVAAAPAGDTTAFGAALVGTDATFQAKPDIFLTSLSIDLGSLDAQNRLYFYSGSTLVDTFTGTQLAAALTGVANGNQVSDKTNGRFYFTFGSGDDINKLVFSATTKPSFEFDNIAATWSAVPEPATWTMLILGFGFVGFMMRSSRQKTAGVLA